MRFAYADPPYLGQSARYYAAHPEHAVYDTVAGHAALIDNIAACYPDGWALSMSARSLRALLPLCPEDVRVLAWVKPYTTFFPGVKVAWAWEPVIVRGGRPRAEAQTTVRDWLRASSPAQHGRGFVGRKPEVFVHWLCQVLNIVSDDTVDDLFPGSGGVGRAIARYLATPELPLVRPVDDVELGSDVL
jgi:hypothetical protein